MVRDTTGTRSVVCAGAAAGVNSAAAANKRVRDKYIGCFLLRASLGVMPAKAGIQ